MRESFVFYASFYEAIKELPEETQLELYTAICKYSLYGELPDLSPVSRALFTVIKPNIDTATARYIASVENGKKGGRPPKAQTQPKPSENPAKPNNNPDITQTKPSENLSVDVNVNDNDNVNANVESKAAKPQSSRFTPPTLAEVQAYCRERNNGIDAEQFIAFYSAKGWKIGSSKMKDWKAAVITWEKREKSKPEKKPAQAYKSESIDDDMLAMLKEKYGIV